MKKIILGLLIVILLFLTGCRSQKTEPVLITCEPGYDLVDDECIKIDEKPTNQFFSLNFDEIERNYLIYLPTGLKADAPVVFVLHGVSGSAINISNYSEMNDLASIHKFAVVYPQGTKFNGVSLWNAELDGPTVDDVRFLEFLATHVQEKFKLSKKNTFITGHSNGGFMSYTMACKSSNTFSAYASYAGLMSNQTWQTCSPSMPANILHIHGTNDIVVPNDGSMPTFGGFGGAPDILTMLGFWTSYNLSDTTAEIDLNEKTHVYEYSSKNNSNIVKYIEIKGQGHSWPKDNQILIDEDSLNDTSQLIWSFFSQFID